MLGLEDVCELWENRAALNMIISNGDGFTVAIYYFRCCAVSENSEHPKRNRICPWALTENKTTQNNNWRFFRNASYIYLCRTTACCKYINKNKCTFQLVYSAMIQFSFAYIDMFWLWDWVFQLFSIVKVLVGVCVCKWIRVIFFNIMPFIAQFYWCLFILDEVVRFDWFYLVENAKYRRNLFESDALNIRFECTRSIAANAFELTNWLGHSFFFFSHSFHQFENGNFFIYFLFAIIHRQSKLFVNVLRLWDSLCIDTTLIDKYK